MKGDDGNHGSAGLRLPTQEKGLAEIVTGARRSGSRTTGSWGHNNLGWDASNFRTSIAKKFDLKVATTAVLSDKRAWSL